MEGMEGVEDMVRESINHKETEQKGNGQGAGGHEDSGQHEHSQEDNKL